MLNSSGDDAEVVVGGAQGLGRDRYQKDPRIPLLHRISKPHSSVGERANAWTLELVGTAR